MSHDNNIPGDQSMFCEKCGAEFERAMMLKTSGQTRIVCPNCKSPGVFFKACSNHTVTFQIPLFKEIDQSIVYINKIGVKKDLIPPDEKIEDIINEMETLYVNLLLNSNLDNYISAKYKDKFVKACIKKSFTSIDEEEYLNVLQWLNINRVLDNRPYAILSMKSFTDRANIFNMIKVGHQKIEKELMNRQKKEDQRIQAEISRKRLYQEFKDLEKNIFKYFNKQLPLEIKKISQMGDIEKIKEYYRGIFSEIKKNINYLNNRYYNYELSSYPLEDKYTPLLRKKVAERLKELEKFIPYKEIISEIIDVNPGYVPDDRYFDEWDLHYYKKPSIDRIINQMLNNRLPSSKKATAEEYFFLFSKKNITPFGCDHLYDVIDNMTLLVNQKEENMGITFLEKYSSKYGSNSKYFDRGIWSFNKMVMFRNEINKIEREAENMTREALSLPKVGKGRISESRLFSEIKKHFKNHKVIQHARLKFLGKQHLDIFIPSLKVAIEYQGMQHDEPIDSFGGLDAFLKNKERDELKKELCQENGIKLIYAREGYNLADIISEILA